MFSVTESLPKRKMFFLCNLKLGGSHVNQKTGYHRRGYVRAAALRHKVVVIDGLKEFTHELKGIGRNLNQLVVLSNMGKIQDVYLGETMEALGQIYCQLRELAELEKR